jgi:hypothetical protein
MCANARVLDPHTTVTLSCCQAAAAAVLREVVDALVESQLNRFRVSMKPPRSNGPEDDDGDLLTTLRKTKKRGQAIARRGNEAGLPGPHVDVGPTEQMIVLRKVIGPCCKWYWGPHDRRDAFVARHLSDQAGYVADETLSDNRPDGSA